MAGRISSGVCDSSAAMRASLIEVATGSASSCHTGSVASTHCPRVIGRGVWASSPIVVASLSQSEASAKAWSNSVRAPVVIPSPSRLAMWSACVFAADQSTPSSPSPPAIAACNWRMMFCIIAGSIPIPDSCRSWSGSIPP